VAILPNIYAKKPIEGELVALAPEEDLRVQKICEILPKFAELLSRFTNAFERSLRPVVFIARNDALLNFSDTSDALVSFRDLVALCVVPYIRALTIDSQIGPQFGNLDPFWCPSENAIIYSNSFWLYPWTLSEDNEHLTTSTPALLSLHDVKYFHGQSSPKLGVESVDELDEPLLEALLQRWQQRYLTKRPHWSELALFRSLNMAYQAAQLPAGVGNTLHDVGRNVALWISACEILAHPKMPDVAASCPAELLKPLAESAEPSLCFWIVLRNRHQDPDPAHLIGLLRAGP
jgi:hypothetical protein